MNKNEDLIGDSISMQEHYGFKEWVNTHRENRDLLQTFLKFRMQFLTEEYLETMTAYQSNDPEELVDGLIDLVVIALGTLSLFDVDPNTAWKCVHTANMSKVVGQKESRPNPLGLPDLIKPSDWKGPDHSGNHGLLDSILLKKEC